MAKTRKSKSPSADAPADSVTTQPVKVQPSWHSGAVPEVKGPPRDVRGRVDWISMFDGRTHRLRLLDVPNVRSLAKIAAARRGMRCSVSIIGDIAWIRSGELDQ